MVEGLEAIVQSGSHNDRVMPAVDEDLNDAAPRLNV